MSMGICDVEGCKRETFMGWRPLSVRIGRQICQYHWEKHKDSDDKFDLHEAFGLPRYKIERVTKALLSGGKIKFCACGVERQPNHTYCDECAKEREHKRKKEYRRMKAQKQLQVIKRFTTERNILECKDCGQERLPGHTYCQKCARLRKQLSNSRRQREYRKRFAQKRA